MAPLILPIARTFGLSPRGALAAGALWALHPGLVVYDNYFMTEGVFNVLAVAGLFFMARPRAPWNGLVGGACLGLAGLVRPLAILYLPMAVALAFRHRTLRGATAAVCCATALLPSALWAWRNQAVGEGFRVTTVGDLNLLYYSAAYATSEERGEDWLDSWPTRVPELSARLEQEVGPGEDVSAAARRLAVKELRARPGAAVRVQVKSAVKLFVDHSVPSLHHLLGLPYNSTGVFSRWVLRERSDTASTSWGPLLLSLSWLGLNALTFLAALAGAVLAWRRRLYLLAGTCALTVVLFTLATGSVGLERMRLPILLPLSLLVGGVFRIPPWGDPQATPPPGSCAGIPPQASGCPVG
jgi:hypothetical protein